MNTEPRWPAALAALAAGGVYMALPDALSLGPRWLLLVLVAGCLVPTVATHRAGHIHWNQRFGFLTLGLLTLFLVYTLGALVVALPAHIETPRQLLFSAIVIWTTNVLVFSVWYWRLDAGGPNARDRRAHHAQGAFQFPQMVGDESHPSQRHWRPGFVDYLFLAFNTATAFSPTDCPVLSRWAKVLMMIESSISLATLALLAARAVNIL